MLICGYTGMMCLGFAAFYGIGAYVAALLAKNAGMPFGVCLLCAGIVSAIIGFVICLPCLRLTVDFVGLITTAFLNIFLAIVRNWNSVTNGATGISAIPRPVIFGKKISSGMDFYYLTFIVMVIAFSLLNNVIHSKIGRNLQGIRDNELGAISVGVKAKRLKLFAFTVGTFFAGVAGCLYAFYISAINPNNFVCNIAPASSSNYLSDLGMTQWLRIVVSDLAQAPRMAAFAKNNLGCSKMAIIYSNTDAGIGIVDNIEAVSGGLGLKIVGKETYNPGTESDFSTLITKVKSLGADVICLQSNYQDGGIILKQMHELGLDLPVVSLSTLTYRATVELAGIDALQNTYCVCTFNPFSEAEINKGFLEKYTAEFGDREIPSSPCGLTYDAVNVICEAIRQGATRENLADWIMNRIPGQSFVMENNMLLGPRVTWADNGNVDSFVSSVIRVDENGDFVPFGDVDTTGLS